MVKILTAITVDGLDAVESAAAEAPADGVSSADIVLNILARSRSAPVEPTIATPDHPRLDIEPIDDAGRYVRPVTPLRTAAWKLIRTSCRSLGAPRSRPECQPDELRGREK